METRKCLNCGEVLRGRKDQKYCSSQCRSDYYNRRHRSENELFRDVNKILKQNRNILKDLNPKGKAVVPMAKMYASGFNFNYFTNLYTTKSGRTYYYCYDFGYFINSDAEECLIVEKQSYIDF